MGNGRHLAAHTERTARYLLGSLNVHAHGGQQSRSLCGSSSSAHDYVNSAAGFLLSEVLAVNSLSYEGFELYLLRIGKLNSGQRLEAYTRFFEEIRKYLRACGGHYRFRVELHTVGHVLPVLYSHNGAVAVGGDYLQAIGKAVSLGYERVIPRNVYRRGKLLEQWGGIVYKYGCLLAVKLLFGAYYPAAERLAYRLMTETDTEHGYPAAETLYYLLGYARLVRRAGTRRDYYRLRCKLFYLIGCYLIIAYYLYIGHHHADCLIQIIGKAVVIIYQKYHFRSFPSWYNLEL